MIQDASGNALATSVIGNRSVFQGAPMAESVSGLVYLRNRWYSPEMGRFVSRDPIGYDAGDINVYRFVGNDPVNKVEPSGLAWSSVDFTWHYFFGAGESVDLGNVGLLDAFKSNPAISDIKTKISWDVAAGNTRGQEKGISHVKDIAWTLGGVETNAIYSCNKCCSGGTTDCNASFSIKEWYSDPFEIWEYGFKDIQPGKENDRNWYYNPGTPYPITAYWEEKFKVPCP